MKTKNILLISLLLLTLYACKDVHEQYRNYTANVPKYLSYAELRNSVKVTAAKPIDSIGKIYIKGNYLFVNEIYKGVHVFDNTDPTAPKNIAFYNIPGNVDMAIKGNYLYADSYIDLVVLDISNINAAKEIYRVKDIFSYTIPTCDYKYPISEIDKSKGVITSWKVERVEQKITSNTYPYYYYDKGMETFLLNADAKSGAQIVGIGGSLARFIIKDNYLYGVNNNNLQVINIQNSTQPSVGSSIPLARIAETLFVENNVLFIGTQTGMLIYDIKEGSIPQLISTFNHFKSCDPVVVQNGYAYITLRQGNRCGNWQNVFQIVDIHVLNSPQLVKSYPLTSPYGLGIDNKTLFICDGNAGLKIYDVTDPLRADENLIKAYPHVKAFDVIPLQKSLILMAADGIYQYNYADLSNIKEISKIPISALKY